MSDETPKIDVDWLVHALAAVQEGVLRVYNVIRKFATALFRPDLFQTANGQRLLLVSCIFLLYLAVIMGFAFAYFRMFKRDPSRFVFASEIAKRQLANKISQTQRLLDNLIRAEQILSSASVRMEKRPEENVPPGWILEMVVDVVDTSTAEPIPIYYILFVTS